jgi:hypothetical protein
MREVDISALLESVEAILAQETFETRIPAHLTKRVVPIIIF